MRNLKRALSLAMASIMILGMMVIGAGAVSYDDFSDKDKIVNQEAVNTMVSLGVINGKEDGSYDPTGIVTRAEMAKLIAVMMTGGKDPTLGNITSNFSDTKGNWADSYIAYCANKGIINGRGDGTFGPNEAVTGSAAAKMVLTALGYRADIEKLTGAEWEINTNVLANKVKLYDGIETVKPQEGLSRDNTAQMIYNGVQADEVVYRNNYGEYSGVIYAQPVNAGTGKSSTVLSVRFDVVKVEGVALANNVIALDDGATTVGAKTRFMVSTTDANGNISQNPATYPVAVKNEMLGNSIVIYVKYQNALAPNAANSTVIGTPILSTKNIVANTHDRLKDEDAVKSFLSGKGLSTIEGTITTSNSNTNKAKGIVTISGEDTGYAPAGATPVRADATATKAMNDNKMSGWDLTFIDNNGDGVVDFLIREVPQLAKITTYDATGKTLTIAGVGNVAFANIGNPEDVAKDDIVLYTKVNETYYFEKSETVSGKVTSFDKSALKVNLDGTAYGESVASVTTNGTDLDEFVANDSYIDGTYTFYLDTYGNAIAWTVSEEALGNYALVLASGGTPSSSSTSSVIDKGEVKLLLPDGTTAVYNVNLLASANKFGGLGANSNSAKETAMATALQNGTYKSTIVTFSVGDDKTVTIGDPDRVTNIDVAAGASAQPVVRTQTSLTIGGKTITVNDSTIFFISDGTDSGVVRGLSNLPTFPIQKSGANASAKGVAYSIANTSKQVAKAVYVDGAFKGASNYVYISSNYTQSQNVNGEAIYTYPAVYEDGKVDFIKVKGSTDESGDTIASGNVYKYTMNSSEYATLKLDGDTINDMVSIYAKGSALTLKPGNGVDAETAKTVLSKPQIWNVEDTKNVYADSLTIGQDLAVALDADGYVKSVFVKDNDLDFYTVSNATGKTLTINTKSVATGSGFTVANGYDVVITGLTNGTVVIYDIISTAGASGNKLDQSVTVKDNKATIGMPDNATLKITGATTDPLPPVKTTYNINFTTANYVGYVFTVDGVVTVPTANVDGITSALKVDQGAVVTIKGAGFTKTGDVVLDAANSIKGKMDAATTTLTFTAAPATRAASTDVTIAITLPTPAAINSAVVPPVDTNAYKISFTTADYPSSTFEFWVSGKKVTPTEEGATARSIDVKATDKVEILASTTPFTAGNFKITDGVIGTATTSLLTFTGVSKAFALAAPGTVTTTALFAVHTGEFVTLSGWSAAPVEVDGVSYVATGTTVKVALSAGTKYLAAADATTMAGTGALASAQATIAADTWISATVPVTVGASTPVVAKYDKAGTATTVSNNQDVVIGTVLTLTPDATKGTAVIEGTTFGAAITTYDVGKTAVTFSNASKLTLGTGVTAVLGTADVPSDSYVATAATPTVTVDAAKGTGVYNQTNENLRTSADGVASGSTFTITKDDANLQPGVKVTLTSITGSYTTSAKFNLVTAKYVASETALSLEGTTASGKKITVDTGSGVALIGAPDYNVPGDSTNKAQASYTLGVVDVTFAMES